MQTFIIIEWISEGGRVQNVTPLWPTNFTIVTSDPCRLSSRLPPCSGRKASHSGILFMFLNYYGIWTGRHSCLTPMRLPPPRFLWVIFPGRRQPQLNSTVLRYTDNSGEWPDRGAFEPLSSSLSPPRVWGGMTLESAVCASRPSSWKGVGRLGSQPCVILAADSVAQVTIWVGKGQALLGGLNCVSHTHTQINMLKP